MYLNLCITYPLSKLCYTLAMTEENKTQIWNEIEKAKNILLHCHPSPDPDSYGSALAMLHFLEGQSKSATLIKGDSPVPDFAQFLVKCGIDSISANSDAVHKIRQVVSRVERKLILEAARRSEE